VCEYCSRTFGHSAQLEDHISTVHLGTIEHRCEQCGKVLGSAITLKRHQERSHERKLQHVCDGCGRQYTRLAGLINHLSCSHPHLLPDKYRRRLEDLVCKECNLTFSGFSSLRRHLEVRHGGAPKYMCPVCSRRFRYRSYVFRHVRIHHPATTNSPDAKTSVMDVDVGNKDRKAMTDVLPQSILD